MASPVPSTPERQRHAEREADRIRRLQMTSPSRRRRRHNYVRRPSITNDPIPQPQFVSSSSSQPPFNPLAVPPAPVRPQCHRNLRNPMVHPPVLNARHIAMRNRSALHTLEQDLNAQRHPDLAARQSDFESVVSPEAHMAQLQELHRRRAELEHQEEQLRQRQQDERRQQTEQRREQARLRHEEQQGQREEAQRRRIEEQQRQREEAQQRRIEEAAERQRIASIPPARRPYHDPPTRHSVGFMNVECQHCHALHFDGEKLSASTRANKKFGMCCLQGQVQLPIIPDPPATLRDLLYGRSPLSPHFHKHIRQYNAALAFTSLGVKVDGSVTGTTGPYSFRVHGELCHRMGSLLPEDPTMEKSYAQLYVHDPDEALNIRQHRNPECDRSIMSELQAMLHNVNPFVSLYQHAFQVMSAKPPEEHRRIAVRLHLKDGADGRRYNLPTANEIAAIVPGNGEENVSSDRDIILRLTGGSLKRQVCFNYEMILRLTKGL